MKYVRKITLPRLKHGGFSSNQNQNRDYVIKAVFVGEYNGIRI
jgi:hypothetical protein